MLLKANKETRRGQYLQIIAIDSVKIRDRLFGAPDDPPGMGEGRTEKVQAAMKNLGALADLSGPPGWSHYVVIDT
jgi:hypothetical protein